MAPLPPEPPLPPAPPWAPPPPPAPTQPLTGDEAPLMPAVVPDDAVAPAARSWPMVVTLEAAEPPPPPLVVDDVPPPDPPDANMAGVAAIPEGPPDPGMPLTLTRVKPAMTPPLVAVVALALDDEPEQPPATMMSVPNLVSPPLVAPEPFPPFAAPPVPPVPPAPTVTATVEPGVRSSTRSAAAAADLGDGC
jgi:hypothetical protein